jgi:hypothetical protein
MLPPWSFGFSSVSSTIKWTDKLYGVASIKSFFFYQWLFEYKTSSQPSFSDARVVEKYCGNVLNVEKGNGSILSALFSAVLSLSIICGSNHWTNVKSGTCGSCLPSNQTRRFLHPHGPCIQGASLGEPRML